MAGHPGLNRPGAALAGAVLLAHVAVLEWAADHLATQAPSQLTAMVPVMYTRTLAPAVVAAPPPVRTSVVAHRPARSAAPPRSAPVPTPAASEPQPEVQEAAALAMDSASATVAARAPEPAAPQVADNPPASAAPEAAAPPAIALDTWPTDTRLNYRLSGQFRSGPLFGDANVAWQREGARYQVKVEVDVTLWLHWTMTSQGELGPEGLMPRVYEEERRGKRRTVRVEGDTVRYEGGRSTARPTGVQDTASQFIELGHRFAQGIVPLEVGHAVQLWLARPGGVDLWTYDVVALEPLALDKLGTVPAYHLKPRPISNARGNVTAEIWFAPALQYLPVRIRINTGEADFLDLAVQAIEQR